MIYIKNPRNNYQLLCPSGKVKQNFVQYIFQIILQQ